MDLQHASGLPADAAGLSSVFAPLTNQLQATIAGLKSRVTELEADEWDYLDLQKKLEVYPETVTREANVHVGPRTLTPSQVVLPNEIYTAIGDGYVIRHSPSSAAKMAGRRITYLREAREQVEAQITELERKLQQLKLISQPDQLIVDDESGLPMMEIREELDEDGNIIDSKATPQATTGLEDFAEQRLNEVMRQVEQSRPSKSAHLDAPTKPEPGTKETITSRSETPGSSSSPGPSSTQSQPKSILKNKMPETVSSKPLPDRAAEIVPSQTEQSKSPETLATSQPAQSSTLHAASSRPPSQIQKPTSRSSGIPNDLFEIEKIALEMDQEEEEEDAEDVFDLEVTDSSLAWTLAGDLDSDDYSDDDDDEDEDEFGRTRGTFFPYLPRGLDTPVSYAPRVPLSSIERTVPTNSTTANPTPPPIPLRESVLERAPQPSGGAGEQSQARVVAEAKTPESAKSPEPKQVRFSENVAVQQFHHQQPSTYVDSEQNITTANLEEAPPPRPKEPSKFKLERQASKSSDDPAPAPAPFVNPLRDVIVERPRSSVPKPAQPSAPTGGISSESSDQGAAPKVSRFRQARKTAQEPEEEDIDPEIHAREIAVEYHRMRQKLIDRRGGYQVKISEKDFVPLDENGEVVKVSRFKSATLRDTPR